MSGEHSPTSPEQPAAASPLDRLNSAMRGTGIRRPVEGRVLGGVCLGVGRRHAIDPVLLRVGFVVAFLFAGVGLLLYVMAVLLLPDAEGRVPLVQALRHREPKAIALLVLLVFLMLTPGFGGGDSDWGRSFIALAIAAGAVAVLLSRTKSSGSVEARGDHATAAGTDAPASPTGSHARGGGLVFDPETGRWGSPDASAPPAAGRPYASAPPPAGPAYEPPAPPTAPRPVLDPEAQRAARRRHRLVTLTTLAFAAVVYTAAFLVLRLAGNTSPTGFAFAITLGAIGLLLVVNGAQRVRNGAAMVLAISGLVIAPGLAYDQTGIHIETESSQDVSVAGSSIDRPASVAELKPSYEHGVGDYHLDLTGIPVEELRRLDLHDVQASLGTGDLRVTVPAAATIEVRPRVGLGDVQVDDMTTGDSREVDRQELENSKHRLVFGEDSPDVVVTAELGVGDLTIERR